MTTEERLSSAERHISELRAQTTTLAQGQTAHDAILSRMGELLESLALAYVDTSGRMGRMEDRMGRVEDRMARLEDRMARLEATVQDLMRVVQAHSVDLSAIRAILERGQNGPGP